MEKYNDRSIYISIGRRTPVNIIDEGIGPLFMDPDPDTARNFFRKKSRKLDKKLMGLKEAISKFIHDVDYIAIGGFGANRTPVAACHEIVRQKRKTSVSPGTPPPTIWKSSSLAKSLTVSTLPMWWVWRPGGFLNDFGSFCWRMMVMKTAALNC